MRTTLNENGRPSAEAFGTPVQSSQRVSAAPIASQSSHAFPMPATPPLAGICATCHEWSGHMRGCPEDESDAAVAFSAAREIPLANGRGVALVDADDYERIVAVGGWCLQKNSNAGSAYAARYRGGAIVYMHRLVMEAPDGMAVDHISGDGLDNRRANLRLCTTGQNTANRAKYGVEAASSRYKGVTRTETKSRPWRARVVKDRQIIHLGKFATEEEAARAYDAAAIAQFGEFASLNFPRPGCPEDAMLAEQAERPRYRIVALKRPVGWVYMLDDRETGKVYAVIANDGVVHCTDCRRDECAHTRFVRECGL